MDPERSQRTDRYPLIVEAPKACCSVSTVSPISTGCIRASTITHSTCLLADGEDLRKLLLTMRKTNLARFTGTPCRRHPPSVIRTGRDRPGSIPQRLPDGLEGLVSKLNDRPTVPAGRRIG
jgi:hypothetical protein